MAIPDPLNGAMNGQAMGNLGASGGAGGMPPIAMLQAHRKKGHSNKVRGHKGRRGGKRGRSRKGY